jgi:ribonucleoside-diphosphate reductase alpha chain
MQIIRQLKGIRGSKPIGFGESRVLSSPDAIAKALEVYLRPPLDLEFDKEDYVKLPIVTDEDINKETQYQICSECGGTVEHEGGCSVCHDCGYSECG